MRLHASADDQEQYTGAPDDTRAPPTRVTVPNAWRRSNVRIDGIPINVPITGEHIHSPRHQMESAILGVVTDHFDRPDAARPFTQRARTIPYAALSDEDSWQSAIRARADNEWCPSAPTPHLEAFAERLPDGKVLVSVSLVNGTAFTSGDFQNHTLYDCRIGAKIEGAATLVPQRFELAPNDYRYSDLVDVVGHGRNCVAVGCGERVVSETLPIYRQPVVESRSDHVAPPKWDDLANDPLPVLRSVESEMRAYLGEWDVFLSDKRLTDPDVFRASQRERGAFADEIRRFQLGMSYLQIDPELMKSFRLANQTFMDANRAEPYDSWRLFQIVYIVAQLPSLAARRHTDDHRLKTELEAADVLWFPTGGGKTEAYLGLVVTALFYDRLRGKSRGVSSWLRFPLRMLSVQQLARVLHVLVTADTLRLRKLENPGDPFTIGYLVGGGGTPNSLFWESGWWRGIERIGHLQQEDLERRRLVAACPACGVKDSVRLRPSLQDVRIYHVCESCEYHLPLYMTDDEVYRYQPSVIISTVDKLTGYAHFGEFTSFSRGPAYRCPDHGYFSFGGCLGRHLCNRPKQEMEAIT